MFLHSLATTTDYNTTSTTEVAEALSEEKVEQQIMVDQRVTAETTGYLDGSNSIPAPVSMAEQNFDHLSVLKVPIKIANASWSTTDVIGTPILEIRIPEILTDFPTIHRQLLQLYAFFKLTIRFKIVANFTKFHSGKLMLIYDPAGSFDNADYRTHFIEQASGFPHVIIDAGDSNSAEFNVPYEHIHSYLSTIQPLPGPQMGHLHLLVYNPLQTSTGGTTTVPVNVFASAAEVQLHLPMRPHYVYGEVPPPVINRKTLAMQIGLSDVIKTGRGVAQTAAGAFADVKSGNFLGAIKKGLSFFSSDRPAKLESGQDRCLSTTSPVTHMQGMDISNRMGATQGGFYNETDFSTAPASDMLVDNIISTPMLVFPGIPWTTAQAEDTIITSFPVTPTMCSYVPPSVEGQGTLMLHTFLSYFGIMHKFWSGPLTYTFDFAATQFHSGRLMFVFEPGSKTATLPGVFANVVDWSNNPNLIFDLRESKKFSFTVDYVATTPRKRCVRYPDLINVNAANPAPQDAILGYIHVIVVQPLVVAEGLPDNVPFNCWISAGPGFKYYVPSIDYDTFFPGDPGCPPIPPITTRRTLAMQIGDDNVLRERQNGESIIKTPTGHTPKDYFGEVLNDVRDYARRYTRWNTNRTLAADPARPQVVWDRTDWFVSPDLGYARNGGTVVTGQSYSTLISRLYAFWAGSIRFKVVPITDRTKSLQLIANYDIGDVGSDLPRALVGWPEYICNSSQDEGLEVEFPFYSHYTQCIVNVDPLNIYPSEVHTPGRFVLTSSAIDSSFPNNLVSQTYYHACGEDIAFRFLISPPFTVMPTPTPV